MPLPGARHVAVFAAPGGPCAHGTRGGWGLATAHAPQMAGRRSWREHLVILKHYWPRLFITCGGWVANDFGRGGSCHTCSDAATVGGRHGTYPCTTGFPLSLLPPSQLSMATSSFNPSSSPSSRPAPRATQACSGRCSTRGCRSWGVSGSTQCCRCAAAALPLAPLLLLIFVHFLECRLLRGIQHRPLVHGPEEVASTGVHHDVSPGGWAHAGRMLGTLGAVAARP